MVKFINVYSFWVYGANNMILVGAEDGLEGGIPPCLFMRELLIDVYMLFDRVSHVKTNKWKRTLEKKLDETNYTGLEKKLILAEFDFAKLFHKGERRKDNGDYYLVHPLEVVLGSKFYLKDGPFTDGTISLGLKAICTAIGVGHDTKESGLVRYKEIDKEIVHNLFIRKHRGHLKKVLTSEEYKQLEKEILIIEKFISEVFTFDREEDNYLSYIDKFFNKNTYKFLGEVYDFPEKSKELDKLILDYMLEIPIVKDLDRVQNNFQMDNLPYEFKLKSSFKNLYCGYRHKSFILKNKKDLDEEKVEKAFRALKNIKKIGIDTSNLITKDIGTKYGTNLIIRDEMNYIDGAKDGYEKKGSLGKITLQEKNGEKGLFDQTIYSYYKSITNENDKPIDIYTGRFIPEKIEHLKKLTKEQMIILHFYSDASLFKRLFSKLDDPKFLVKGFNLTYLKKVDESIQNNNVLESPEVYNIKYSGPHEDKVAASTINN